MQAHVKIWFLSGAFERVDADNGRAQELATIYAEAETNDRVVAAELHREDGSVAASFDHRVPAVCGAVWFASSRTVCARPLGHNGNHRTTEEQEAHSFSWFPHECAQPETGTDADRAPAQRCSECGRITYHKMDCSRGRLAPLT